MKKHILWLVGYLLIISCTDGQQSGYAWELWYDSPAQEWMQALPVGNGRLGAMVYGGTAQETIALNEITLWSGEPDPNQEISFGKERLAEMRQLFFDGKIKEGNEQASKYLVGAPHTFGSHLPFGDLTLSFRHEAQPSGYRRTLDLQNAVATVNYTVGDVLFTREVFCSNPQQVLVIHLKADKKKAISLTAAMNMMREEAKITVSDRGFLLNGTVSYPKFGKGGVAFASEILFQTKGGSITTDGQSLQITEADEVTVLIDINTNLKLPEPAQISADHIAAATLKDYKTLKKEHTHDFSRLFNRVDLSLGTSQSDSPTDKRLARLKEGVDDPDLAALFMQYGRYLLISCSREDSPLPANLQGLWNDNLACSMAWTCDYHLDINTQQNYWAANTGNLPECNTPLFGFMDYLAKAGSKTARNVYGSPGWVAHTVVNVWGYTAPGSGIGWGLHPTGGVWLASHLWEHYLYTGNTEYLQTTAYPILKEAARFIADYLAVNPNNGYLMTGPSTSPENAFLFEGRAYAASMMPTCDLVLIRNLFTACIECGRLLNQDKSFCDSLQQNLDKLPPLQIGKSGRLQEWFEDYEEASPNHRHTSHLLALYPFNQISTERTPELAEAAARTIERKLGLQDWEDVEWSRANSINYYARLKESEKAWESVKMLLTDMTRENMLTISVKGIAGAPWDIFIFDGNEAGAAGIMEMLLQSQEGYIELLPALPAEWHTGSFKGLCVRGGAEVDAEWKDGIIQKATLRATTDNVFRIKLPADKGRFRITKNNKELLADTHQGITSVDLKKEESLRITLIQ
ncbi:hypothetical protein EZS27_014304 [termite gut metagenome]|uniref:Uncharacterized protein n=1 Tax=termite gut metagenome TaxID=433724 RepID=A0A5J4RUI0_9ZZZZ